MGKTSVKLDSYPKFNKFQMDFYRDFAEAEGIKWAGSGWAYESVPEGLGEDVYFLAGEPYGAITAFNKDVSYEFLEAADGHGIPRDLCGYMLNYWGGIIQDKYVLPDGTLYDYFPKPDFNYTLQLCCSHAKWYQYAGELEGGTPTRAIDIIAGPRAYDKKNVVDYVSRQVEESIDWMEDVTGREFDDDLFIKAVKNEMKTMSYWAKITNLQKHQPPPLEERRMFTLYAPSIARRSLDETVELYKGLYEEAKGMAERGDTVGDPAEPLRYITDTPPPWGALRIMNNIEEKYGAVSVGSLYSMGLTGAWEGYRGGDGWSWEPAPTPMEQGVEIEDRDTAIREMVKWNFLRPSWNTFASHMDARIETTLKLMEEFDCDFAIFHRNRGCEGWSQQQTEVSNALKEKGYPVLEYEGNQADTRDFDESGVENKVDAFMEGLGVEKKK